jgi:hypothetical protein
VVGEETEGKRKPEDLEGQQQHRLHRYCHPDRPHPLFLNPPNVVRVEKINTESNNANQTSAKRAFVSFWPSPIPLFTLNPSFLILDQNRRDENIY